MCPTAATMAVASFGIQAASSLLGYHGQKNAAAAQNAYYEQNRSNAISAASDQYAARQNQLLNERAAASQQLQETQLEGLKARSAATVAAGEAGVAGHSVDALIDDYLAQQGRNERTIGRNYQMQADAITGDMDSVAAQTTSRINSVQKAAKPSFLPTAINILGAGIGASDQYIQNTGAYQALADRRSASAAARKSSTRMPS